MVKCGLLKARDESSILSKRTKYMKIGFTGSREGMSPLQIQHLVLLLCELKPSEFHHGDCKGADEEAHKIVEEFFPECRIVVHPPESDYLRAFCAAHEYKEPLGYVARDRKIVEDTVYLIGAPLTDVEQVRSGSWTTIRHARKLSRPLIVLQR